MLDFRVSWSRTEQRSTGAVWTHKLHIREKKDPTSLCQAVHPKWPIRCLQSSLKCISLKCLSVQQHFNRNYPLLSRKVLNILYWKTKSSYRSQKSIIPIPCILQSFPTFLIILQISPLSFKTAVFGFLFFFFKQSLSIIIWVHEASGLNIYLLNIKEFIIRFTSWFSWYPSLTCGTRFFKI